MVEPRTADNDVRKFLAIGLSVGSFAVVIALGIACLVLAREVDEADKRFGYAKDILGVLLPVTSAWMGTIIAFYFSKENFDAATRNSLALVKQLTPDQKLATLPIGDGMIPIEGIDPKLVIEGSKTPANYKLKADLLGPLADKRRERLPIFGEGGCILLMAHRSLIDKFIVKKVGENPAITPDGLTLQDLSNDSEAGPVMTGSFRTLPPSASLADAKRLMDTIPGLSDVFVTVDGTKQTKVLGWVTDGKILEKSKA